MADNCRHSDILFWKKSILWLLILLATSYHPIGIAENTGVFQYQNDGESYPYSVKQTGDNYTFEFEKNPGKEGKKLKAAAHVPAIGIW